MLSTETLRRDMLDRLVRVRAFPINRAISTIFGIKHFILNLQIYNLFLVWQQDNIIIMVRILITAKTNIILHHRDAIIVYPCSIGTIYRTALSWIMICKWLLVIVKSVSTFNITNGACWVHLARNLLSERSYLSVYIPAWSGPPGGCYIYAFDRFDCRFRAVKAVRSLC